MRLPRYVLFSLFFFLLVIPVHAADVVIIQSSPIEVYETARNAFLAALSTQSPTVGPKRIVSFETETLLLSDFKEQDSARAAIEHFDPRLLFTLGQAALEFAAGLHETPIVFALAVNPAKVTGTNRQITGVSLEIAPERQLNLFLSRFSFKRPGLIFNENHAASFAAQAEKAAVAHGMEPVVREVEHVKEAPGMLKSMAENIDALWLVPDTTVLTPSNMEYLAYYSLKYKIPIFSFSEKLLKYGATAATVFDIQDMGRQAAGLAVRILEGVPPASLAIQEPEKVELMVNKAVAKNLGLDTRTSPGRQLHEGAP